MPCPKGQKSSVCVDLISDMNRWEGDRAAWKCWLMSNGSAEVKSILEILSLCWAGLLVTAEALDIPVVLDLARSVGSHFHMPFSWRAEVLSLPYTLVRAGFRRCPAVCCCFQTCPVILGTDTMGSWVPKSQRSWCQHGLRNGRKCGCLVG